MWAAIDAALARLTGRYDWIAELVKTVEAAEAVEAADELDPER